MINKQTYKITQQLIVIKQPDNKYSRQIIMSTPFTMCQTSFRRCHKPSFTESDLATEDSLMSNFNSLGLDENYSSNPSVILKENFSSVNSNNVTFGEFLNGNGKKNKENNLAYAISDKFPPKIRKQVQAIIDYYEGQLEGQRQMYWKVTQGRKNKKKQEKVQLILENSRREDTRAKDERINELENRLMEKEEKIIELNKEITTLMTKYARLKKQHGERSPNKSIKGLNRGDLIKNYE